MKLGLRIFCTKINLKRCLAECLARNPCIVVVDEDRVRLDVHLSHIANRSTSNGVNKNLGLNDLYKDYSYFPMILHTTELTGVYYRTTTTIATATKMNANVSTKANPREA